jgi:hypothetical protein
VSPISLINPPAPATEHTRIPGPRTAGEAILRATPGRSADGLNWVMRSDEHTVTAVTTTGTVAEARVSEPDERMVVELWVRDGMLPPDLVAAFVGRVFALPAARPQRPVLVCLPRRDAALLAQTQSYVRSAWTRAAGSTCLIEGRITQPPATADSNARHAASSSRAV